MSRWVGKIFGSRTAVEERQQNPLLEETVALSSSIYSEIPLRQYIDDARRDKLARKLYLELNEICNAEDPVARCRQRIAETMLQVSAYQVLVIPPAPHQDFSGLRGLPGISGELQSHLKELFRSNSDLRSALFKNGGGDSQAELLNFAERRFWELFWLFETVDAARVELGDSVPGDDWKQPFMHAACATSEHMYRWDLQLPSAFDESIAREASTAYAVFTDIVVSGNKNPAAEWRDYYAGTGVPMPRFTQPTKAKG